jgi:starvation-inducible DNA-binding protein
MKASIGISDKHAQAVGEILNRLLADEQVLYTKTRNYHWNIEGDNFYELHKFYEAQYTELAEAIDEVAERIRKIGHFATGRLKDFLELTSLEEQDYSNEEHVQIKNLLDDHETISRTIRGHIGTISDQYKDLGTADFLTGLLKQHEQWAWMLRAHLK